MSAPAEAARPTVTAAPSLPRRGAELWLLLGGLLVALVYSAAAQSGLIGRVTMDFWVPAVMVYGIFGGVHEALRRLAPQSDPVLLPIVAFINALGVVFLRRLDLGAVGAVDRPHYSLVAGLAARQVLWTAVAAVGAVLLLAFVRDHRVLSKYAYTLGLAGIALVLIPALLPDSMSVVNGAKLWVLLGPLSVQPGEFAKLALLSFFAYYLVRKREVLAMATWRLFGVDLPRGRDLGPVLMVWLLSLLVLVFEKDLGTSLLYFGMFVVTLYIATERAGWLLIGLVLFFGGASLAWLIGENFGGPLGNFAVRVDTWVDPFGDANGAGYQLVQSLLGLGTGGLFGAGPGAGIPYLTGVGRYVLPEVHNDFIFAGIGEEIGLFGLSALLVLYLLFVTRGLRVAVSVRDLFGKLLAGGLSFTLGLQVFVIIGGVSGLIPLTGQTTPFLSAGGSSLVANWLLLALLLRISDVARRPVGAAVSAVAPGSGGQLHEAPTEVW